MTDERPDDKRSDPPSEGVRIIGAEEAAEALERGDVAQRRGDDQPRYGDRPTPPAADGPRPVLRFPLGSSSDPRDIERPPVAPAEPISEPVELPHWTEPPTARSRRSSPSAPGDEGDDLDDWTSFATSTPRWRDDADSFDDHEGFEDMQAWGDEAEQEPARGALDDRERPTHDDYFTFADLDETGTTVALGVRRRARRSTRASGRAGRTPPSPTRSPRRAAPAGAHPPGARRRLPAAAHRPPARAAATATWAWRSSSASASSASPSCCSASAPPPP